MSVPFYKYEELVERAAAGIPVEDIEQVREAAEKVLAHYTKAVAELDQNPVNADKCKSLYKLARAMIVCSKSVLAALPPCV